MTAFNIALLQLAPAGSDVEANAAIGEAACRRAGAMGADLALFPEMWSIGYARCPGDDAGRDAWRASATPADGAFVAGFCSLAAELDMAIAVTYLERTDAALRNAVTLIDRLGSVAFTYAKVHTCEFDWERELQPGDAFRVAEVDTAAGPVRFGAMICYDREFPESARVLMLEGAEIILVPNACEVEHNRGAQLHARAYENMCGIALANYPHCGGRSMAVDGIAFSRDESSRDMTIAEAGAGEEIVMASFDLDALRAYREHETWGDAYRKPGAYAALVRNEARAPFIRKDARRW